MFPRYEKIVESTADWRLDEAGWRRLRRAEWVVTEKIHGANFCLATDGTTVRCANRREWLSEHHAFFGWQAIRDTLAPAVLDAFREFRSSIAGAEMVYVYGELFGGGYPHPDIDPVAGVQPVQTGVWYAPDIRFCAYDVRVADESGAQRYLDYVDVVNLLPCAGIPSAEPLFIGRYEAAMDCPIRFDSTLPRRLGLPPLATGSNSAEGVVIKPYRELDLRDQSGAPVRPVLKRKIVEYAEDRRFHEAEKWSAAVLADASSILDLLKWEAYSRVTENRLRAAISKVGPSRQGRVFALLLDEILSEVRDGIPDLWAAGTTADRAELESYVSGELRALLCRAAPQRAVGRAVG